MCIIIELEHNKYAIFVHHLKKIQFKLSYRFLSACCIYVDMAKVCWKSLYYLAIFSPRSKKFLSRIRQLCASAKCESHQKVWRRQLTRIILSDVINFLIFVWIFACF